jgi:hypothetical protein
MHPRVPLTLNEPLIGDLSITENLNPRVASMLLWCYAEE